jgi:hypothetical protein
VILVDIQSPNEAALPDPRNCKGASKK